MQQSSSHPTTEAAQTVVDVTATEYLSILGHVVSTSLLSESSERQGQGSQGQCQEQHRQPSHSATG